jgi:DNA-binding protein H-NS
VSICVARRTRYFYFEERRIVHSGQLAAVAAGRAALYAAPRNVIQSAAPAISRVVIGEPAMNTSSANLKAMSFDKLSKLRDRVDAILNAKVAEERRAVQSRLNELDRLATNGGRAKGAGRGSRGAVPPKYCNLENPAETWAGRGLKPRWLAAALKSGKKIEDFSIEGSAKSPRTRRKKTTKH